MALRIASWMVRLGALLGVASFFIPQVRESGKPAISPFAECVEELSTLPMDILMVNAGVLLAPVVGCLLVLGTWPARSRDSRAFRWVLYLDLFLWTVLLATLGSITATYDSPLRSQGSDATASTLLLFVAPLLLLALLIARVFGGPGSIPSGAFFTASAGLLVLAQSLYELVSPFVETVAGAFVPLAAGGLIAAGAFLALARSRRDTPAAVPERA